MTTRLLRSELATPGSDARMIEKAATRGADLVFLDLEDAVAPPAKARARALVREALTGLDWGATARAVRINPVGSEWAHSDLVEAVGGAIDDIDVVIVPKVMGPGDVQWVDGILGELERDSGRAEPVALQVLIEECEALVRVDEIARSSPRLEALIFGSGDFAASQGVRTSRMGELGDALWLYQRSRILVAAAAAGIAAVDGPSWCAVDDLDGYRRECEATSIMGFAGKWAIHPAQVPIANAAFGPWPEELVRAREVTSAYGAALALGTGAINLDGQLVDMVDLRLAQAVIARSEQVAAREGRSPSGGF